MIRAVCVVVCLSLCGCAAWVPMAISAAGGATTIMRDVFDIDVAWHQLTPGKTPIAKALAP